MLTTTTQHALRALTALAVLPPGQRLLTRELARITRTPVNYLSKILVTLEHAGLVTGKRGLHGGYCLAKKPEDISLAWVVQVLEGPGGSPTCLLAGFRDCSDENGCPAHQRFRKLRAQWEQFLADTSVAHLAEGAEKDVAKHFSLWHGEGGKV